MATNRRKGKAPSGIDGPIFPIVGIGASAGGLAAFEAFFSGMPATADPGMAFVLVQHLAPDHKSLLSDLVRRYTRMQVFEVADGMAVKPNCAYIIPPNRDMAFLNGVLELIPPAEPRGHRLPIDFFFRSLAQDQREQAICIVLSGTGSDGTRGVRAVKAEGGMVMAQNPESTEFDGMPISAIATGLVDYVLPVAEMPAQLIAYVSRAFPAKGRRVSPPAGKSEDAMNQIFAVLRSQIGHDFSEYKQHTIFRRVERRMAVHGIDQLDEYVRFLEQTPIEGEALFRDLLIGVTGFFRDTEAFAALQQGVIPALFAAKPEGGSIRAWVPGCSTGEEAYSIGILLQERLEALKKSFKLQVFATDIDPHAIANARAGVYPASIDRDVSPERLAHFFVKEPDGHSYRIHKSIRDLVIFSEQNVIKDPPFSRLDLISCRNLLIYLGPGLQRKAIPLFHYALNPRGVLFVGASESVGEFEDLFASTDRKSRLYVRKDGVRGDSRLGFFPSLPEDQPLPLRSGKRWEERVLPLGEFAEQELLQQYAPSGALVGPRGDILYLHRHTGKYLEPAPDEAHLNILSGGVSGGSGERASNCSTEIDALKLELRAKEKWLQTINEELRSSNEEMQSMNEEMQSANEELQTSKEELQSANEELNTVNNELQTRVAELSRSNNDMINLLAGTGIGTLFVDHDLRIRRFTPAITQVINLIVTDVGRPLAHIATKLVGYDRLEADVQAVLDSLQPKEIEVKTRSGSWYLLRIRPYRTLENVVEGAVLTFIEGTGMKAAQATVEESLMRRPSA